MDSHRIQSFQSGDEEEVVRVFEAAFGESDYYFPRSVRSWIWRYMQRPGFDPNSVLMIRKKGTVVAALSMTYATMMVNDEPKKLALIDDVSTHPQWRKQGLATALMRRAITRADEVGCWGINLCADPEGSAIRIYKSVGFGVITNSITMLSVLKHRRAARFGRRRHTIPLLTQSLLDSYRNMRIDKDLCSVEIAENKAATDIVKRSQDAFHLPNGTLLLDDEYIKWMTDQRPDGSLKVASITLASELAGMVSVSSSDFSGPGAEDRMAAIGNLTLSDSIDTDVLLSALHGAKMIAKNILDCPMVNMFIDERDEGKREACKKAGFMEIGKSASMFHHLGHPERLSEIQDGTWSQPVETVSSNP